MPTLAAVPKVSTMPDVARALDQGDGVLRLAPCWVPRSFLTPGRRLKLHPDDYYALGAHRGGTLDVDHEQAVSPGGEHPIQGHADKGVSVGHHARRGGPDDLATCPIEGKNSARVRRRRTDQVTVDQTRCLIACPMPIVVVQVVTA